MEGRIEIATSVNASIIFQYRPKNKEISVYVHNQGSGSGCTQRELEFSEIVRLSKYLKTIIKGRKKVKKDKDVMALLEGLSDLGSEPNSSRVEDASAIQDLINKATSILGEINNE